MSTFFHKTVLLVKVKICHPQRLTTHSGPRSVFIFNGRRLGLSPGNNKQAGAHPKAATRQRGLVAKLPGRQLVELEKRWGGGELLSNTPGLSCGRGSRLALSGSAGGDEAKGWLQRGRSEHQGCPAIRGSAHHWTHPSRS